MCAAVATLTPRSDTFADKGFAALARLRLNPSGERTRQPGADRPLCAVQQLKIQLHRAHPSTD
jgi:hypothetical protein